MNRKMIYLLSASAILLQTSAISCLGTPVAGSGLENAGNNLVTALQTAFGLS